MKKVFKIICLFVVLLSLTGCGTKKELTSEQVKKVLRDNNFTVSDFSDQMEDKSIKTVYSANNGAYQIGYYLFSDEKDAKNAFNSNMKYFNDSNKKKGKKKSEDNYDTYVQNLSDTYNSLTRVGKNLFYVSVNSSYKSDCKKIIKKLTK